MQLTDRELWHILQVEPAAKPLPWERDAKPVPGTAWIEWAKTEVLSGVGAVSKAGIHLERCSVYLARLVRVLDILTEYGFSQANRHMKDGVAVYEEDYLNILLVNGLEACDYSSGNTEKALWFAKRDGFLTDRKVDAWHPGMPSGSGMRTCYGLTFKGKKQAEKASVMPPVCEDASLETPKAESAASPKHPTSKDNGENPPSTSEQQPTIPAEDMKNALLIVFLLLAQAYYKLLESAVRNSCAAMDLDLNGQYLWVVNNLKNLLKNNQELSDYPGTFEPSFEDLMPSSIVDVDWEDMVAPDAERFLSTVQQYVMTKGTYPPDEGTASWILVETFKSSVNEAIQVGETYSKRMAQEFRKFIGTKKPSGSGTSDSPVTPKTVTNEASKTATPSASEHAVPKSAQTSGAPRNTEPVHCRQSIMRKVWEPRTMLWNQKAFIIEKPVLCFLAYDPEVCNYDDFPEDPNERPSSEEIKHLHTLSFVSLETTLTVHALLEKAEAIYPERIESSGNSLGWHPGGAIVVKGTAFNIHGVRVEETDLKERTQIEAERRARTPMPEIAPIGGSTHHKSEGAAGSSRKHDSNAGIQNDGDKTDGMRFTDFGKIHELSMPSFPEKTGAQELLIGGRAELGCTGRKYRIFRVFDCRDAGEPDTWPMIEVWDSNKKEDVRCHVLSWTFLVYDDRDAYKVNITLTFESQNEALLVKNQRPYKVLAEPIFGHYADDEKITVCFPVQSVVRNSSDAGSLVLENPTQAELDRLAKYQELPKIRGTQGIDGGSVALDRTLDREAPLARNQEPTKKTEPTDPTLIKNVEAAMRLCRSNPNKAFAHWKSLENGPPPGDACNAAHEAELQFLKSWFERCGHWRDLKLDAATPPIDASGAKDELQRIVDFVSSQRTKQQYIDYDEVHADHVRKVSDKEKEYTEYTWTYFLSGEPQVILRVDDPDLQMSATEEHYLSKAKPYAFAYWVDCDELGIREVNVFFQSRKCLGFMCGYDGSIYPEDRINEGDYELRKVNENPSAQKTKDNKPSVMDEAAIHNLCVSNPNQAFLYWKSSEEDLDRCPSLGQDEERKIRAMRDTFQEWFEDLGHWRDLNPKSKDLDPDDHKAHAKHQNQIKHFIASRQAQIRVVEYDSVKPTFESKRECEDYEEVEYKWTYLRHGEPQVVLTFQAANKLPANVPVKQFFFGGIRPYGYAIAERRGTAYFRNGKHVTFECCYNGKSYPPRNLDNGDYLLQEADPKRPSIDEEIRKNTALIPDILQEVKTTPLKTAALLGGANKPKLGNLGTVVEEDFTASPHFTNITWRGNKYVLGQNAARIIEALYIAQKHYGIPGMHQNEVFGQVYGSNKKNWPSGNTRIQNFFRQNDAKRLWTDGCIDHDGKGNFHLNIKIHT